VEPAKAAEPVTLAVRVRVQVPVPAHPPPLQPENVDPPAGLAVRVTTVPLLYEAEQVAPQLIPAGFDVTVPPPEPDLFTVRVKVCGRSKVAVTVVAAFMVTTQEPAPEQPPPLQPEKVEPPAAAAVKVTTVPLL